MGLAQCPLWVKSRHLQRKTACPLYPESGHVQCTAHVRFVPKADIASLIDDFVGAGYQWRWHGEPERFCGLEVDR